MNFLGSKFGNLAISFCGFSDENLPKILKKNLLINEI